MSVVIFASILISFLLLKVISNNFETIKDFKGTLYALLFITGVYFLATGNGLHEVASFLFNTFCDTKHVAHGACGSMFFNDYYFGNILYFIGLLVSNFALVLLEIKKPNKFSDKKNVTITIINSLVFALTLFAYDAFDRVLVGLIFTAIAAILTDILLFTAKRNYRQLPFTVYCALAYSTATIASILIRFR